MLEKTANYLCYFEYLGRLKYLATGLDASLLFFVRREVESIPQHFQRPFAVTNGIFSKCLVNRLPVWRVDFDWDESLDSSRIESIRQ